MEWQDEMSDADYHKANLNKVTADAVHLAPEEQKRLNFLLKWCEHLFDGNLGQWNGKPVKFELKDNVKPHHAKPFPIPQALEVAAHKEAERLCKTGTLR